MSEDDFIRFRVSAERKAAYVKSAGKLALSSWIKMTLDAATDVDLPLPVEPLVTKPEKKAKKAIGVPSKKPFVCRLKDYKP